MNLGGDDDDDEVLPGEVGGEEVMEGAVLLQTQTFSLAPSPKEMSTNNVVKKVRKTFFGFAMQKLCYTKFLKSPSILSECEGITWLDLIQHW